MLFAVVENGYVAELYYAKKPRDETHVLVSTRCQEGWQYVNGVFYPPLDEYKAERLREIREAAGRRIQAWYSLADGKQLNMLARMAELLDARVGGRALSPAEQAESDTLQAAWNWVKAVRAAGKAAAVSVLGAVDGPAVDLVSVDWPAAAPPDWPL